VRAYCEDGRAFIRASTKRMNEWHEKEKEVKVPLKASNAKKEKKTNLPTIRVLPIPRVISHFVMNLPATAIEFLGTCS